MTGTSAERLADLLLRNATAIIFVVVFVFFGLQSVISSVPRMSSTSSNRRHSPAWLPSE